MDGLILIDKPQELTSHDIVAKLRDILNFKKIGHCGTLDPLATGLLVITLGKATRLFPFLSKTDKTYEGRIRLGFSTDTYDATGKPASPKKKKYPDKNSLQKTIRKFKGEISQLPPPYSAKKYKGKPLYSLARGKKEFQLKPSHITIYSFQLTQYQPPEFEFIVKCSSGTYIRSLAHDLGQILGCGAHLSELTRTETGNFQLKQSFSLDEIREITRKGRIEEFIIPMESLLPEFPKIILKDRGSVLARNGNMIPAEDILKLIDEDVSVLETIDEKESIFRMFSLDGKLLALAKRASEKNCLHPFLVIDSKELNK